MLMDFVDPRNRRSGKHAGYMIRFQDTMIEFCPESNGFSFHRKLAVQLPFIHNSLNRADEFVIQPFISIEIQHPVRCGLFQGEIALGCEIVGPGTEADAGAMGLGQFYSFIGTPRVDDQDFGSALLGIFHDVDDIVFFIFCQNQYG